MLDSPLFIAVATLCLYALAWRFYGGWLGRRVFRLDPRRATPATRLRDDQDYAPANRWVVFGHHFTSIAGTGPILGPAIGLLWGWVPALLWVVFGSIFLGAVHDFTTLAASLRNDGRTVGEIAGRVLNPRVRAGFLFLLFATLTVVLAVFGLVIARVFQMFPGAILPCALQTPLAIWAGFRLRRRGDRELLPLSLLILALMYVSVALGGTEALAGPLKFLAGLGVAWWTAILLAYSFLASVLPVWTLLQPRDYINSLQLLSALGLVFAGLVVATVRGGDGGGEVAMAAPAFRGDTGEAAPAIFPFLFITIACGAISGFHCLVASGVSSKQLARETDAKLVGFGAMLAEGFLAVLALLSCAAGIGMGIAGEGGSRLTGRSAWMARYEGIQAGLGAKVGAFVDGAGNFLGAIGLSGSFATALLGTLVASFAMTTMDSACRLQRHILQEAGGLFLRGREGARASGWRRLPALLAGNRHAASLLAVCAAFWLAMTPAGEGMPRGSGGMLLWPLFGATNQLLAGIAFLVALAWLRKERMPRWFALPPAFFMLVIPAWAMLAQLFDGKGGGWLERGEWRLAAVACLSLGLELWLVAEALACWKEDRARSGRREYCNLQN